ncbi:hypothetical protein [Herbaspirillum sp. RV1423]|uniref:hypothetical protein n=1 Tax=Herbaspirillum sp. RV1423 TaxID=1443993 RepID=UPI0012DF0A72|nr:hypothetical protein [Herbaspirillum sp. RV1423]
MFVGKILRGAFRIDITNVSEVVRDPASSRSWHRPMAVPTLESAGPTLTGRFAKQGKKRLGGNSLADIVAQDVWIVYVTRAGEGMKVWANTEKADLTFPWWKVVTSQFPIASLIRWSTLSCRSPSPSFLEGLAYDT